MVHTPVHPRRGETVCRDVVAPPADEQQRRDWVTPLESWCSLDPDIQPSEKFDEGDQGTGEVRRGSGSKAIPGIETFGTPTSATFAPGLHPQMAQSGYADERT
jgi:hypothetical protein